MTFIILSAGLIIISLGLHICNHLLYLNPSFLIKGQKKKGSAEFYFLNIFKIEV